MKTFIKLIFGVLFAALVAGCGVAKNTTLTSYVERGTGYAMREDIAFHKAFHNALTKISNENSAQIENTERQVYVSNEKSRGRSTENLVYETNSVLKSSASTSHIKIKRAKTRKRLFRNEYICRMKVSVEFDDVN